MVTGESGGAEKRTVIVLLGGRTPRGTMTVGGGWRALITFVSGVGVAVTLTGVTGDGAGIVVEAADKMDGDCVGVGEVPAAVLLATDVPVDPSGAMDGEGAGVLVAGEPVSVSRGDVVVGAVDVGVDVDRSGVGAPVAAETVVAGGIGVLAPVAVGGVVGEAVGEAVGGVVGEGVGEAVGGVAVAVPEAMTVGVLEPATVGVSVAATGTVSVGVVVEVVAMTVGVPATTVVVVMAALVGVSAAVSVVVLDKGDGAGMSVDVTGTVGATAMALMSAMAIVLMAPPIEEGTGAITAGAVGSVTDTGIVADGSMARAPAWYPGRASMAAPQSSRAA